MNKTTLIRGGGFIEAGGFIETGGFLFSVLLNWGILELGHIRKGPSRGDVVHIFSN